MAELSTEDRVRIWRGLMRLWSQERTAVSATKAKLLTTVEETDTWIDDNAGSFNSALTYAAEFTTAQKTLIFCAVALARVSIAFLRRVFGEVD